MEKVFHVATGVTIPFPEAIKEEFEMYGHGINFNLSFEKIKPLFDNFLDQLTEPLFFVLEIPLSQQEEDALGNRNRLESTHKKVCYLDGQTKDQIKSIMDKYGDLLLNDGLSQLAVASHETHDELYIQKYKVMTLLSKNPDNYVDLLKGYGLVQTNNLVTAWQTFSKEMPGEARRENINGIDVYDVYDVYERLKEIGLICY